MREEDELYQLFIPNCLLSRLYCLKARILLLSPLSLEGQGRTKLGGVPSGHLLPVAILHMVGQVTHFSLSPQDKTQPMQTPSLFSFLGYRLPRLVPCQLKRSAANGRLYMRQVKCYLKTEYLQGVTFWLRQVLNKPPSYLGMLRWSSIKAQNLNMTDMFL